MKDFLACTELVTLVHHVKTATSDSYVCYPIQGVSWYAKTETAVTADGAKAVNVYKVRIPEAVLPSCLPEKLDYLVKGEISGVSQAGRPQRLDLFPDHRGTPTTGAGLFRMWR